MLLWTTLSLTSASSPVPIDDRLMTESWMLITFVTWVGSAPSILDSIDAATRIWSKLGEEGEVERVTRLKTECLCVVLKRKIKDLTEMGADCTQLEEQLAVIETALAESASSKSSIGTESEE